MKNLLFIILLIILVSLASTQINAIYLSNVNASISRAINFLYENQLDYGEFKTLACEDKLMQNCYFDSSPFVTTFVLYSMKGMKDKKIEIMKDKALNFLLNEQEQGGIWRYWISKNTGKISPIPPDLDVISTVSFILKINNRSFDNNLKLISKNKNNDNLFFTWVTDAENKETICCLMNKTFKNDADCVVNANVLLYLGQNDQRICSYINNAIKFNESCSKYYPNRLVLYYAVSRAFENNVTCFEEVKNVITKSTLNYQNKDGSFGNALDTALALNTLLNFKYNGNEINLGVNNLLQKQSTNGSWEKAIFFLGPPPSYGSASEELTTALVIEAMNKYLHIPEL